MCVLSATVIFALQRRIVNGQDTIPNEYPMMAGIVERGGSTIACGATIISKRYVVTAAHCLKGRQANNLAVVVGEHDISRGGKKTAVKSLFVKAPPMAQTQPTDRLSPKPL